MLKYVLLGGLSYRPLSGYELKLFVDTSAGHFWHAQTSQIYRTLAQLEKDGLLKSEIKEQQERPDRRIYHLTPEGLADLRQWLAEPMTEIAQTKDALLIRMFFATLLDKETVLLQLRLQRSLHQKQLMLYRDEIAPIIRKQAEDLPMLKTDAMMWELTRRNGELIEEAYIRWLDEAIQHIEDHYQGDPRNHE
jgi:PadR family transcriptional regulator AphA